MNRKTVKIVAIVIAVIFLLGIAVPLTYVYVWSAPPENDSQLAEIEEKKNLTLEGIAKTEKELNEASEKVRDLKEKINASATELEGIDQKLDEAEKAEQAYEKDCGTRFRVMCEKGMMSYLDILFSATSLTDFTDRIVIAKELAEYDKNVMTEIKEIKSGISENKKSAEELMKEQQQAMAELDGAIAELEQKQKESKEALAELERDKAAYIEYTEKKNAEQEELKKLYASDGVVSTYDVPKGMFVWPTAVKTITSPFSPSRVNPVSGKVLPHTGIDIGAGSGEPVVATAGGTVSFAGENGGYGNCIIIDHGNGISTLYGHLSSIITTKGAEVLQGDMIGRVGSTGNSTGPHLHYEIILGKTSVDPMGYLR